MSNIMSKVDSAIRSMKLARDPMVPIESRIEHCKEVLRYTMVEHPKSFLNLQYENMIKDLQVELITKEVLDVLGKD